METSPRYYDLLDRFKEPGCPVCALILRDAARYIDSILYEYVNKVQTNQAFRDGRGLCNHHTAQLDGAKGNVLGITILMHAVLDEVVKIEESGGNNSPGSSTGSWTRWFNRPNSPSLADALEPVGPCIICDYANAAEASYLDVLNSFITVARMQEVYEQSPGGLCLPHVRMALRVMPADRGQTLLRLQRQHWLRLRRELVMFMDKYNLSKPIEEMGEEGDSWRRALRYLGGEEGVFGLRRNPR